MKKIQKVTLKDAVVLDNSQMKQILGGSGNTGSGDTPKCSPWQGYSGSIDGYVCSTNWGQGQASIICAPNAEEAYQIYINTSSGTTPTCGTLEDAMRHGSFGYSHNGYYGWGV